MVTNEALMTYQKAKLVLFDFDGVLMDSNSAKLECFLELAAVAGPAAVSRLKALLSIRPYATRFEVVESIIDDLEANSSITGDELLRRFSDCSKSKILKLQVSPALAALRAADSRAWALVSATEQCDMQEIAHRLSISDYFEAGVFGSPKSKFEHIRELGEVHSIRGCDMILLGDRLSDLQATVKAGIGFIFVSDWSDSSSKDLTELTLGPTVDSLSSIIEAIESLA